ncbi:MAG: glycosyl hydrolase-related protein, partial [Actinomycetota bacterium]|nr:glycosyl hydrolase-related protein [Actinomycetota bacterium]
LELDARYSVLSACKPSQDGDGIVVRVLNPTDESDDVTLHLGREVRRARPVGLDEQPSDFLVTHNGRDVGFPVPPHALRSVQLTLV